jgi:hypothetical protein
LDVVSKLPRWAYRRKDTIDRNKVKDHAEVASGKLQMLDETVGAADWRSEGVP